VTSGILLLVCSWGFPSSVVRSFGSVPLARSLRWRDLNVLSSCAVFVGVSHFLFALCFCDVFRRLASIATPRILCNYAHRAVPWLRRLAAGFPPRRPGFDPGSVHVGFVVDKVALG
jgi:hypothetical protein